MLFGDKIRELRDEQAKVFKLLFGSRNKIIAIKN